MPNPVVVIWNPGSGSAPEAEDALRFLSAKPDTIVHETRSPDHARRQAKEAVVQGTSLLVAAGGDGTVHTVASALADTGSDTRLGIIPLGTGNDLARTLAIPLEPLAAAELLFSGMERRIDLVEVASEKETRWCFNVAIGGNSEQVQAALTDELKRRWGALVYVRNTALVLNDLITYDVEVQIDDSPLKTFRALNVVVANGRTCAGGIEVAPQANPEDGLLDVGIIQDGSPLDLAALATDYLLGGLLRNELVRFYRARRVRITAEPAIQFSVDGEPFAAQPVTFSVRPQAMNVVVGPDYVAQPVESVEYTKP